MCIGKQYDRKLRVIYGGQCSQPVTEGQTQHNRQQAELMSTQDGGVP